MIYYKYTIYATKNKVRASPSTNQPIGQNYDTFPVIIRYLLLPCTASYTLYIPYTPYVVILVYMIHQVAAYQHHSRLNS